MSTATMERPQLSPTQLEMIAKCPAAYERSYILGEKIPPGIAAITGTGVHAGASTNFRQKLTTFRDLPASDIVEASVASFEAATHMGYTMTDQEMSRGPANVLGRAKDHVVSLSRLLADEVVGDYQPTLVEEKVRIELPEASHDLLGILDLADDQLRVIDFKTGSKARTQGDADTSIQLTTYAAAHKVLLGELPREVRLECLVKKNEPERVTIRSTREVGHFVALAHRINAVLALIQSGIFPPASPGSWWCSERWCGYWKTCPYVHSAAPAVYEIKQPARRGIDGAPVSESLDDTRSVDLSQLPDVVPAKRKGTYRNPRERLWSHDPHCRWCGRELSKKSATLDHIVPLSQGGANREENYCLSCRECNQLRGSTGLSPQNAAAAAGDER